MNIFETFDTFMKVYDLYPHPVPNHPGYTCDRLGSVYRPDGSKINPFKSLGYDQVYMKDDNGKRSIKGVHQVVSMTFDQAYYPGCVVHHEDENKEHNWFENLTVESREDHSRHHASPDALIRYNKENGPANKGKKMSKDFCDKCRISALKRHQNEPNNGFTGNQFVNTDRSPKEVSEEYKQRFSEACRRGALNRNK